MHLVYCTISPIIPKRKNVMKIDIKKAADLRLRAESNYLNCKTMELLCDGTMSSLFDVPMSVAEVTPGHYSLTSEY